MTTSAVSPPHPAAMGPRPAAEVTLELTTAPEALAAGRTVVRMIADASENDTTNASVERVATLRFLFPDVAVRVAEFHAFMDELVAADRIDDVHRIMRDPHGRGRRRTSLFLVALVDQVRDENPEWTAKRAAQHVFDFVERGDRLPYIPIMERIQNVYAEYRKWYALWKQSLYVPSEIITAESWQEPGTERPAPELTATILPGMVILHPPSGGAGIAGDYSFEALRRLFRTAGERIPLVGANDPEFGPYTRYAPTDPSGVIQRCNEGWRQLSQREWLEALQRRRLDDDAEPSE